jgi:endonuclease III
VKRVFKRLGLISKEATNDELIYCARELSPEYPGIFDFPAFDIGKNYCHPRKPDCKNCYLNKYCPKII